LVPCKTTAVKPRLMPSCWAVQPLTQAPMMVARVPINAENPGQWMVTILALLLVTLGHTKFKKGGIAFCSP